MIFFNILKKLSDKNLVNFSNKKIKNLINLYKKDKERIKFIRSKLIYGKVVFQLEYKYFKGKYLLNTEFKPILVNQVNNSQNKYSVENILNYTSIKKDIWGFFFYLLLLFFSFTFIYISLYNYIYVDLGNDPKFLCFKSTIYRINSNYFDELLCNDPLQDFIGNTDLFPNSDLTVFISGCSKSRFTRDFNFFLNEISTALGFRI